MSTISACEHSVAQLTLEPTVLRTAAQRHVGLTEQHAIGLFDPTDTRGLSMTHRAKSNSACLTVLLLCLFMFSFLTGCTPVVRREIISTNTGGPGELWILLQEVKGTEGSAKTDTNKYVLYYCTTSGCKRVGALSAAAEVPEEK